MRIAARIADGGSCVYVDLDETLIHTFPLDDADSVNAFVQYPGEKIQGYDGYGTVLRPGANEFLARLQALNIGPIYLLTHSISSYAETMVAAFGLDVDAVFPRESLNGRVGKGEKNFVLVDDLDPLHFVFQMKARAMGIPVLEGEIDDDVLRAYYSVWQIKPSEFIGDPMDRGLDGLSDSVAAIFNDLSIVS